MDSKKIILTAEDIEDYKAELEERRKKRDEIIENLKVARAQGDLSENAEFDAAREEQGKNEAEIRKIEEILKNAEVADETSTDDSVVSMGSNVKILDVEYNEEFEYRIVGSTKSDLMNGKISSDSPVGEALLGKKTGEEIVVHTDDGDLVYKILEVSKSKSK